MRLFIQNCVILSILKILYIHLAQLSDVRTCSLVADIRSDPTVIPTRAAVTQYEENGLKNKQRPCSSVSTMLQVRLVYSLPPSVSICLPSLFPCRAFTSVYLCVWIFCCNPSVQILCRHRNRHKTTLCWDLQTESLHEPNLGRSWLWTEYYSSNQKQASLIHAVWCSDTESRHNTRLMLAVLWGHSRTQWWFMPTLQNYHVSVNDTTVSFLSLRGWTAMETSLQTMP